MKLKGVEDKASDNITFILVEKNRSWNFVLYYKSIFCYDILTLPNY